jgi:biofilm PGA synthesis N-glycosyltransferase PgaC
MYHTTKYLIITPVRDEEKHIEKTIHSVCSQTMLPNEWIIVNDGSTDRTGEILDEYAARIPWLHCVHRPNRGFRKSGGGVVEAFNDGYARKSHNDWEFIVKLDGDLEFSPKYFEKCLDHFRSEPELGIGGGEIYHQFGDQLKLESNPQFHVRGATKIYRRACWEAIGGLWPAPGWDTIDEVKANMLGWKTRAFPELQLHHQRLTGAADGLLRDSVKHGLVCYVARYHPLFFAASCFYRLRRKPYFAVPAAMAYGFLKGLLQAHTRVNDKDYVRYIRRQQLRRLLGLETIWR